jgi:hypothetical protein
MTVQREKDYDETGEEIARHQWWDDLRARSLGTCRIREWTYLWIGVMLRRVAAAHPGTAYLSARSYRNWVTLVDRQRNIPGDPNAPEDYRERIHDFLHEQDSPWGITCDRVRDKYSIERVGTLDDDIAFARDKQSKRMDEEKRLREEADGKYSSGPVLSFPRS